MNYHYAPIAFFAYKRPEQTFRSLVSLANNSGAAESELFIYCDGPKASHDEVAVRQTRQVARDRQWCRQVHIIEQATNRGLARSVIDGVTRLVEEFGRVIVLEDDLLVARGFLDYVNRALGQYESVEHVLQISGHMFHIHDRSSEHDAFFMPMVTSWGWATWKRAWRLFDPRATGYAALKHDEDLRDKFDLNGSYPYSAMLLAQMAGEIDSWAIRWWWSVFRNHGLSLYPKTSLIRNIGFQTGATNTKGPDIYYNDPCWSEDNVVALLPEKVEVNRVNFEQVQLCLSLAMRVSVFRRVKQRIKYLASTILG